MIRPNAGETIRLQLHAHRKRVGIGGTHALLHAADLLGRADQVLHVMAHLVRDHVGLREIAWRAEAL